MREKLGIFGGMMALIGIAGLAEACTDQGSFIVSAIVFSIGFGFALYGFKGKA